jgi:Putative mono-oxygenase ydhR
MYVQIVEFELQGVAGGEYGALCEELAPSFAQLPGLIGKVWVVDRETNRAGGVYIWADRAACEAYKAGELYRAAVDNPRLANLASRQFDVLEAATRITSGLSAPA